MLGRLEALEVDEKRPGFEEGSSEKWNSLDREHVGCPRLFLHRSLVQKESLS